ncbi:hypothetical protein [Leeuwenhoekiella marinoflava]
MATLLHFLVFIFGLVLGIYIERNYSKKAKTLNWNLKKLRRAILGR